MQVLHVPKSCPELSRRTPRIFLQHKFALVRSRAIASVVTRTFSVKRVCSDCNRFKRVRSKSFLHGFSLPPPFSLSLPPLSLSLSLHIHLFLATVSALVSFELVLGALSPAAVWSALSPDPQPLLSISSVSSSTSLVCG